MKKYNIEIIMKDGTTQLFDYPPNLDYSLPYDPDNYILWERSFKDSKKMIEMLEKLTDEEQYDIVESED